MGVYTHIMCVTCIHSVAEWHGTITSLLTCRAHMPPAIKVLVIITTASGCGKAAGVTEAVRAVATEANQLCYMLLLVTMGSIVGLSLPPCTLLCCRRHACIRMHARPGIPSAVCTA